MGVDRPSLVGLGPAHDYAGFAFLDYPQVQVAVFLGVRCPGAISLRVGHRTVHCQVMLLHILKVLHKPRVVLCAILGV